MAKKNIFLPHFPSFFFSAFSLLPFPLLFFSVLHKNDVELCFFCGCCQVICTAKNNFFLFPFFLFFLSFFLFSFSFLTPSHFFVSYTKMMYRTVFFSCGCWQIIYILQKNIFFFPTFLVFFYSVCFSLFSCSVTILFFHYFFPVHFCPFSSQFLFFPLSLLHFLFFFSFPPFSFLFTHSCLIFPFCLFTFPFSPIPLSFSLPFCFPPFFFPFSFIFSIPFSFHFFLSTFSFFFFFIPLFFSLCPVFLIFLFFFLFHAFPLFLSPLFLLNRGFLKSFSDLHHLYLHLSAHLTLINQLVICRSKHHQKMVTEKRKIVQNKEIQT